MSKETGGPAFPVTIQSNRNGDTMQHDNDFGMTLRDYFAAQAMQACTSLVNIEVLNAFPPSTVTMLAKDAYRIADAMLKERDA